MTQLQIHVQNYLFRTEELTTHSDSILQRQTFWYPDEELVCYWTISAL